MKSLNPEGQGREIAENDFKDSEDRWILGKKQLNLEGVLGNYEVYW